MTFSRFPLFTRFAVALFALLPCLLPLGCGGSGNGVGVNPLPDPDDDVPPSDVADFAATPGLDSIVLSWQAATDNEGVAGYRVALIEPQFSGLGDAQTTRILGPGVTSLAWNGLVGGITYTFSIVAIDLSNNLSSTVALVSASPVSPDETPPEDVTGLGGAGGWSDPTTRDFVSLNLSWSPSTSDDVSHYLLCIGSDVGLCDILTNHNVGAVTNVTVPSSAGPVTASDLSTPLTIDVRYFIRLIAVDESGNQSLGSVALVTPTESTDSTPPDQVRTLTADPGNTSVVLSWDEPLPIGDASRYAVYFRSPPGDTAVDWTLFDTTASLTASVTGLSNGVTYEFMVAAIDDSGNETRGASTPEVADDDAAKVTAIPTSNLILASTSVEGGVFRVEDFVGRSVFVIVSSTVDGLLSADANTELYFTLDGSQIDTTAPTNDQFNGFLDFSSPNVTEVEPGRLYAIEIDFDPSVAGNQTIAENVLRPSGAADHVTLKYLVRTPDDASAIFSETYLIFSDLAARDFYKFSGMRATRGRPTATVLSGGTTAGDVITIGGNNGGVPESLALASASRYRTQFEHFEGIAAPNSALTTRRAYHEATLLSTDGETILISGGFNRDGLSSAADVDNRTLALASTELFDANPTTEGFGGGVDLSFARSLHTATRLFDGRVVMIGGLNGETNLRGSVATPEVIVPSPGEEDTTPTKLTFDPSAGGDVGNIIGGVIEILVGATVSRTGIVTKAAPNQTDQTLYDLTIDGFLTDNLPGELFRVINGATATAEVFSAAGAAVGTSGSMSIPRYGHTATLLQDGTVFVCGGAFDFDTSATNPRGDSLNEFLCEIYDPRFDTFVSVGLAGELGDTRFFHTATLLRDGKVLIVGGVNRGDFIFRSAQYGGGYSIRSSAYLFDPFTRTMEKVGNLQTGRAMHAAALLPNGEVLIVGGQTSISAAGLVTYTSSAEIYNPVTKTFSSTSGSMIAAREAPIAVTFPGNIRNTSLAGKVLVTSGSFNTLAEIYDPSSRRFEATAHSLTGDRYVGASVTELTDGRVMVAGGQQDNRFGARGDFHSSIELYDSSSIRFEPSARTMNKARRHHQSTLLLDGRVLITGGENDDGGLADCEIYDPSEDTYTVVSKMTEERYKHTATLLPDGRVFVCGGANVIGPLQTCEIFNPSTGFFTSAPSLSVGRFDHTATLLPNGWILITGGEGIDDSSVEIFDLDSGDFLTAPNVSSMLLGRDGHTAIQPTYTIGRARFTTGSNVVVGSDGTNPFGFAATNWVTAGVRPGDVIYSSNDLRPYVIATVADSQLTLADQTNYDYDDAGFGGIGTGDALTGNPVTSGFEYYRIVSQDVMVVGGEVNTLATEVFVFDPGADQWPASNPTDYAFFSGQDLLSGRDGHGVVALPDFSVAVAGGRSVFTGESTSIGGTPSDVTDDVWSASLLDPPTEDLDFASGFRARNNRAVFIHQHSGRAFLNDDP